MATARTSTTAEAALLVGTQLATVLAEIPGGGNQLIRAALVDYLCSRQAAVMVAAILADATTETPADVADPMRRDMVIGLAERIRAAVGP